MPDYAAASGTKRHTYTDLPLARGGTGERQTGDVDAGDEEHYAHRAHQHEQQLSHRLHHPVLRANEAVLPAGCFDVAKDGVDLGGRRLDRDAVSQTREHRRPRPGDWAGHGFYRDRNPELRRPIRKGKFFREDADDLVVLAVELQRPTDNGGIAAEVAPPGDSTQNHDGRRVVDLFARAKESPKHGSHPEHRQDRRLDQRTLEPCRLLVPAERPQRRDAEPDVRQRPRPRLEREAFRDSYRARLLDRLTGRRLRGGNGNDELHQPIGVLVGQRLEQ